MEISAFRLALPLDVLRMVESTIVPSMTTTSGENDEDTFIGNPWVWQRKLLFHYSGQDTVLAERMILSRLVSKSLMSPLLILSLDANTMGLNANTTK